MRFLKRFFSWVDRHFLVINLTIWLYILGSNYYQLRSSYITQYEACKEFSWQRFSDYTFCLKTFDYLSANLRACEERVDDRYAALCKLDRLESLVKYDMISMFGMVGKDIWWKLTAKDD